ncbi:MAG: NrfD/PsrC family molybdoenzyme membrane anchor subunit [Acidimicrobiia bacterium]
MGAELTWGMPVILYLFLAGLGAGIVTVSSSVLLRGGGGGFGGGHFTLARYGALIGPIPVIVGTGFIVLELGRPFRALNLFKVINLSPMSVGSWLLLLFIFLSIFYALAFLPTFMPQFERLSNRLDPVRKALAWVNVPLGISVAVYTGILLGAMPSRPLWNSPILALLFMISALSTGVATIILVRTIFHRKGSDSAVEQQFHDSAYLLTATDVMLIGFELMVIFLFVMFAHLTIGNVKYAVSVILPGGEMALIFWVGVVLVGLLMPALVELVYVVPKLLYHRDYAAPKGVEIVVSTAVLIGGFMLRYVIVIAGQITGPKGL